MAEDPKKYIGARYPRLFSGSANYNKDGARSGLVGAEARVSISIDNYPQAITRISVQHAFVVADAVVIADPGVYAQLHAIDEDATIQITATQQDITASATHLANIQGRGSTVPMPLAAPYYLKGTNQVTVVLRRLIGYPTLGEQAINPVAFVTLVSVSVQSDLAPAGVPPQSVGAFPRR